MAIEYLLDTNIVSFLIRQPTPALQQRLQRTQASRVAISVVTEMELRYGLARKPTTRLAAIVEEVLRGITLLPLTSEVAPHYGEVRAALDRRGRPIGPLDLMIAAHSLAARATLITSNVREFRRVPGLRCEDWTR